MLEEKVIGPKIYLICDKETEFNFKYVLDDFLAAPKLSYLQKTEFSRFDDIAHNSFISKQN